VIAAALRAGEHSRTMDAGADGVAPDNAGLLGPGFPRPPLTEASTESAVTDLPLPKAKPDRLIVREIDGETLVYDRSRDAASCLNEFAAKVWRECDGETSVSEIAAALGEHERAVWLALHQLTKVVWVNAFPANALQISTWPFQRLPWLHAGSHMIVAIEDEFERPRRPSSDIGRPVAGRPQP
jgi:hypothetical protein